MVRLDTNDLIDSEGVAEILGLSHRNTVLQYQERYSDMPRPVFDLGKGRVKLWLRSDMKRWAAQHAVGKHRRGPRSSPQ
jgi:glutathione-regulated potassium-efflux system ancillary protein KefG